MPEIEQTEYRKIEKGKEQENFKQLVRLWDLKKGIYSCQKPEQRWTSWKWDHEEEVQWNLQAIVRKRDGQGAPAIVRDVTDSADGATSIVRIGPGNSIAVWVDWIRSRALGF